MKLHDFSQPSPQSKHPPSPPPQSSTQGLSSSTQPPFTKPPSSQPPPSYPHVFHNSISADILTLQAQQQSMLNFQSALLTNQSLLMEHFMNMQLKMESFETTQKEILDFLKTRFPPPPPPESDI